MFRFNSLLTLYSCEGTVNVNERGDCCFHLVTKDDPQRIMDNKYCIKLVRTDNFNRETNYNNYCPFDRDTIEKHLKFINHLYPIEYSITECDGMLSSDNLIIDEEDDDDDYDDDYIEAYKYEAPYYKIDLKVSGALIYHKLVLKLIRPLYEFPFNSIFNDILKINERVPELAKHGFINLYNYLGILHHYSSFGAMGDQALCDFYNIVEYVSIAEFKNKLAEFAEKDIDDQMLEEVFIYKPHDDNLGNLIRSLEGFNQIFRTNIMYDIDFWGDECFNKKVVVYKEFLNKILQINNNE